MNEINNNNLKLLYPLYKNNSFSITKEIYRGELYCNLLKTFTKSCIINLGEKVFSHKKSANRTITNLLSNWFFTLYQYYDFSNDPFYPTNYNYMGILKKTLEDYCSIYTIIDRDIKINKIIIDLTNNYKLLLEKLNDMPENSDNIIINKINITQTRYYYEIPFYKFILNNNDSIVISNNKLNNIINNIIIPVNQYNIMKSRYTDNIDFIDTIIWIQLYRYQLLSSNNNQLGVLQTILDKMKVDFNLSCECFASGINGSLSTYCSIYYDIERYFGSIGSFFNIIPIKGTYSFNPPYQYDIISNGINKIILNLDNTNEDLCFIITIPIWDNMGKKYMADNMSENNNNIIEYNDFDAMNIIRNSKYFKGLKMISKDKFTYFDHNFYLYKNKTIQNTYVIVMNNIVDSNYIDIISTYDFYNYNIL